MKIEITAPPLELAGIIKANSMFVASAHRFTHIAENVERVEFTIQTCVPAEAESVKITVLAAFRARWQRSRTLAAKFRKKSFTGEDFEALAIKPSSYDWGYTSKGEGDYPSTETFENGTYEIKGEMFVPGDLKSFQSGTRHFMLMQDVLNSIVMHRAEKIALPIYEVML